ELTPKANGGAQALHEKTDDVHTEQLSTLALLDALEERSYVSAMLLERYLGSLATKSLQATAAPDGADTLLRPTQHPRFGDYQINGALPLAKKRGENPRALASQIAAALEDEEAIASTEVAGPGFVNLRLSDAWLSSALTEMLRDPRRLDVPETRHPE